MQHSTLVVVILAVLAVLGAGWLFFMNGGALPATEDSEHTQGMLVPGNPEGLSSDTEVIIEEDTAGNAAPSAPISATVSYSANGFSPSSVTIKVGGTVTFVDQGTGKMWVASAQHPTHTAYSGTTLSEHCDDAADVSFDQCKNGPTYSFTFNKAGTWRYHNHSQASHFGSVTVVE